MAKTKVIITEKQNNKKLPTGIRMLVRRACNAVLITEEFLDPAEVNVTFVDDDEIKMLADNDVKVVHNPNSNLKLASGHRFLYNEMRNKGVCIGLGTDGCSSSNNLDMIESMKMMSLLQKGWRHDPTALPAEETLKVASENGAKILNIDSGKIEKGKLADIFLVDINTPAFTPFNNNTISNLVYAANGNNVDTVICDGRVIMENRRVAGEEEILQKVNELVSNLIKH